MKSVSLYKSRWFGYHQNVESEEEEGEGQANKKNIVYWRSEIGTTMKIKT